MNDPAPEGDEIEYSTAWNWKLIAAGVVALLALVFILQNRAPGTIYFLFFDWTIGVWVALAVTFASGMLVGLLLARSLRRRRER